MQFGGKFICQKDSFLCAAKGVAVGIEFSKKLGRGLFGGEGFIMQKLEGDGKAFVHSGGTLAKKELAAGEILKVDTGCIVGFTQTVDYDIEFIGGIKNSLLEAKAYFMPHFVVLERYMFNRFLLADWPIGLLLRRPKQEAIAAKKAVC